MTLSHPLVPVLLLLTIGAADPGARVIEAGAIRTFRIGAAPARMLVDPGAPSIALVTRAMAERAGLKAGPFAMAYLVGPVRVSGRTAVARVDFGDGVERKRIGWTERPFAPGIDGSVGPGGLRTDVVRFVLRSARAGERVTTLPMTDGGGVLGGAAGLFALVPVEGVPTRIRFDLRRRENLTSAGLAQTLARVGDGRLDADRREAMIAFGVVRPVRLLTLARPLTVGPLVIARIDVRTGDFGNAEGIRTADQPVDPDEIVVTAGGRRDRRRDRLTVGTDALVGCSSLTFDKRAKAVRLSCL